VSLLVELKDSQGNILKQQNRQRTELYKSVISQENDYLATIKRHFFSAFQSYRAAFNEPRALNPNQKPTASYGTVFHLDGIIAAVGDSKATSIFKDMPQSRYGGIPNDWFNTNIVGDIASVLLRRQDLKKSTLIDEQFSRIMNRWMGADEMHIRRCADKSRELRTLGVIVMGVGSSRAEVILEVLRRGLCNHLFIDFNLLVSLVRLIKKIIAEVTSR
jgi:hypothetical protein